jgi:tetratricopeptide (TPR) repeat protein
MDADTYPDKNVTEFITQNFISLRVLSDAIPLSTDFNVQGAPTFILLDTSGKEHYRAVGFIPAEEMIPLLLFGIAKTYFDLDQFDQAIQKLDIIISEHPKSYTAPEATYLRGVYGYKSTRDRKHLRQACEKLRHEYKQIGWAIRALPLAKSIIMLLVSYFRKN